jgi:hypothetical protein
MMRSVLALPALSILSVVCSAQSSTVGQTALGRCAGHTSDPGCVIPALYGPTGFELPNTFHAAHFQTNVQSSFNGALTSAIATQLATLPLVSPSSGITFKYDKAAGVFVPTSKSFGPIYTERAETVGRGHFSFGVSYQRFRFSTIDGIDLHNLPAVFSHFPEFGVAAAPYEADFISTTNNFDLKMDQTTAFSTVGITDRLDVSISIPIVSTRFSASSNAFINRVAGPSPIAFPTTCSTASVSSGQAHFFDPCQPETSTRKTFTNSGSASGMGDVTFRVKAGLLNRRWFRVATALDLRVPSGDALALLGSGAYGVRPFVAVSGVGRVSPHLNVGYQWNGQSILAAGTRANQSNITGVQFATLQSTPTGPNETFVQVPTRGLPDQFFYSIGADVAATGRLTLIGDYLGQLLINAPRVFATPFQTAAPGLNFSGTSFNSIAGGVDTMGLNNAALGFKLNVGGGLLLTADLLFRLDNRGLRQDVTPMIALTYAFRSGK